MSYRREDPGAFLDAHGWPFKRQGRELVTTCPFCDKPAYLYMHSESGVWKCHRCGEAGNLWQLRKRLGLDTGQFQSFGQALGSKPKRIPWEQVEKLHTALLSDTEALSYCTITRRWSLEVLKRFQIGLRVDGRGKWLAYPWGRQGVCVGMKYRILPAYQDKYPERFEREAGCESVLFNHDALVKFEEIILASGESDALSLLTLGFENVVATTTGETSLPASAVDALSRKSRVLAIFDNDVTGQKGAREIGKRIGFDRTWLVLLPAGVHDVSDFLIQGGTREAFEELRANAMQFDVQSVFSLGQALDRLEEEKTFRSWDRLDEMTPWPSVNRLVRLWRLGNLIVVGAPPRVGKTTLLLNVLMFWAQRGFPVLFYCLEMGVDELVQHVLCAHYRLTEDEITPAIIARARQDLAEWPLYLGGDARITGRQEILDVLRQAVRRYGLKLLVFDNLHFLARSVEHNREEIAVLTKDFKLLAMELEIPILLVAQPRKLQTGQIMSLWDLFGSVSLSCDADQVILLHREMLAPTRDGNGTERQGSEDNLSSVTLIRLEKGRHVPSRDTTLFLEGAQHRFREVTGEDVESRAAKGSQAASRSPYREGDGA